MRHKVYGKHLSRNKNQRTALYRSLIRNLFLQESIQTTETKAKAIKGLADRLIVKSKQNTNAAKLVVTSTIPQKEVSDKLFKEIAPRYQNRQSGFTTMVRLGKRLGDGAEMVLISLIKADEIKQDKKPNQANKSDIQKGHSENKKASSKDKEVTDNSVVSA
ncbi:50S ribosomal protein L17 [Patescibacteria group bacterium]|nr:50S ribosomal protein L17 [Patescibacteria group bacterium]MCL5409352.1 50S ribosomal protein L17 [Patescibacteria group bacterium]